MLKNLCFLYHVCETVTIFYVLQSIRIDLLKTDTCWTSCQLLYAKASFVSMPTELAGIKNINLYTYKELRVASDNFSPANKIGEGGFGLVYKVTAHFMFYIV